MENCENRHYHHYIFTPKTGKKLPKTGDAVLVFRAEDFVQAQSMCKSQKYTRFFVCFFFQVKFRLGCDALGKRLIFGHLDRLGGRKKTKEDPIVACERLGTRRLVIRGEPEESNESKHTNQTEIIQKDNREEVALRAPLYAVPRCSVVRPPLPIVEQSSTPGCGPNEPYQTLSDIVERK